jgi:hypothetical protein
LATAIFSLAIGLAAKADAPMQNAAQATAARVNFAI